MAAKKIKIEKQFICFHLLNNYSGSPYVLSLIIRALKEDGCKVTLYTSGGKGFLSGITQIKKHDLLYKWKSNKILLAILLVLTQIQLFILVLFKYPFKKNQVLYINTILPFGAALAGWLLRKEIIYHIHEHYIRPNIMQKVAISVMRLTASKVIFVSKYLQKETLIKQPSTVLPNSLSSEFCSISNSFLENKKEQKSTLRNVLMVSSLKTYKGVLIFLDLARNLPEYQFSLVAGTSQKEVTEFKKKYSSSKNLTIYSEQSNLHPFYQNADIILNLTIPEFCIETFGLTILEGMAYGLPAIVPPVGGPAELVKNEINGYLINSSEIEKLTLAVQNIFENKELYSRLSQASFLMSKNYSYSNIKNQLYTIIEN